MLIREQGRLIKVLRVEPPKQPPTRGRRREHVLGTFRADEPIPPALLDALTRDERRALARWLAVYRESQARTDARPVLADADQLWAQLHAIARTLKRAGHLRPRAARRPPAPLPGQQDFFDERDELEQLAEQ
ncbi:hypothetical protein J2785_007409 [Burkholderia ambifaria]|nr:hypothetical protein [Burkholderia ambifaria]MDR6504212.1 hypothetical protein [Burkholderia ambifaria]